MSIIRLPKWVNRVLGVEDQTALYGNGGGNYSKQCVNQETALALSAVWACAKLIAESIASLPFGLYSLDSRGDQVAINDSQLYRLLRNSPNADQTAIEYWSITVANILLWGNSYSLKEYSGSGKSRKVVSITPLSPKLMSFVGNPDGSLTYKYMPVIGPQVTYTEDQIAHFKGFSMGGRFGLSVIYYATNSFGAAMALDQAAGTLYANGLRPSGALTMPSFMKKGQRDDIRQSLKADIGGVQNTGGVLILEGGMKFEPLGIPPEDAQLLESRGFSVEEVCRWFSVPPVLIGHSDKTTTWGSGIEQLNLGFLQYCITPLLTRLEQQVQQSFLTPVERMNTFCTFDVSGFLRTDAAGRAALYSSGTQNGWLQRAEVRRKENLPYAGPDTETLTAQSALLPLDKLGEQPATGTPAKLKGALDA